jgi:hypothetical protein
MRPLVVLLLSCVASAALSADATPPGVVHPDPDVPDPRFKPHQLPFELPADGVARAEFRSERFYAVLLASPPACSVTEAQRLEIQAQFPGRKVFTTRFECDGEDEELVTYSNVKAGVGFIAVFAGRTLAEAKGFLATVLASGKYPGANLRRMQVVLVTP